MPFLRNIWYVAAWDDEVPVDGMFHRRILDEDILFFRDKAGAPHAMRNRCPHRFAPLHLGELDDGVVECAYHGLKFGVDGSCVHNPHGDGTIPPNAKVRTYPVVAKQMLIWIWMGEPDEADASLIPDFDGFDTSRFAINKGYMHTATNYEYMTDNIMDLGHIEFLHKGLLGSEAVRKAETQTRQQGNVVYSNRLTRNEILPPALDDLFGSEGAPVDRWLDVIWYPPGNMQIIVGATAAGQPERVGKETPGVHLMTPETETTTHYFWSNSRDFRVDDHELHENLGLGLRYAFEEQDKPMIVAQFQAVDGEDFWDLNPVILEGDGAAVRARRILRKMIRSEQAALAAE